MSTRRAYVITCDDESGCDNEYVTSHEDAGAARLDAGGNHWRQRRAVDILDRVRWLDICPDHRRDGDA